MKKTTATGGGSGLPKNVAALLSYVLGFVSGIVFLLIEKDKFVRFHAMQSIFISVAGFIVQTAFSMVGLYMFVGLVGYLVVGVYVLMIIKAYGGEKYKLPFIGDLAEKYS